MGMYVLRNLYLEALDRWNSAGTAAFRLLVLFRLDDEDPGPNAFAVFILEAVMLCLTSLCASAARGAVARCERSEPLASHLASEASRSWRRVSFSASTARHCLLSQGSLATLALII